MQAPPSRFTMLPCNSALSDDLIAKKKKKMEKHSGFGVLFVWLFSPKNWVQMIICFDSVCVDY